MPSTDTDLKLRWESLTKAVRAKTITVDEIDRESRAIHYAWEDVLRQRRKGVLTDTTRIDDVTNAIKLATAFMDFKIRIELIEGEKNELYYAEEWIVRMHYADDRSRFDEKRWLRIANKINDELKPLEFVDTDHPEMGFDDSDFPLFSVVDWYVDVWPWHGPNENPDLIFPPLPECYE